jgi:hypothetical protein
MSRSRRKTEIASVAALVVILSSAGVTAALAQDEPVAPAAPAGGSVSPDNWLPNAAPANWLPNFAVSSDTPDNWLPNAMPASNWLPAAALGPTAADQSGNWLPNAVPAGNWLPAAALGPAAAVQTGNWLPGAPMDPPADGTAANTQPTGHTVSV